MVAVDADWRAGGGAGESIEVDVCGKGKMEVIAKRANYSKNTVKEHLRKLFKMVFKCDI